MKLFEEFSKQTTKANLDDILINMSLSVVQFKKFENYKICFQLLKAGEKPQCGQCELENDKESWLFTEIKFAKTLLKEDLTLLIIVYEQRKLQKKQLKRLFFAESYQQMQQLSFIRGFSTINLSEKFNEFQMKDGFAKKLPLINFYVYDKTQPLISQSYIADQELTQKFMLQLQFAFFSSIQKNYLNLGLEKSQIVRRKNFTQKLISKQKIVEQTDFLYQNQREIYENNVLQLRKSQNILVVRLNQLNIIQNQSEMNICFIQIFCKHSSQETSLKLFCDKDTPNSFYYQTPLMNLKKTNSVKIDSEFRLNISNEIIKMKDLSLDLVFIIFVPQANGISNKKIEEEFLKYSIENFDMTPVLIGQIKIIDNNSVIDQGVVNFEQVQGAEIIKKRKTLFKKVNEFGNLNFEIELISSNLSQNSINELINQSDFFKNLKFKLEPNDIILHFQPIIEMLFNRIGQDKVNQAVIQNSFNSILYIMKLFKTDKQFLPYKKLMKDFFMMRNRELKFGKNLIGNLLNKFNEFTDQKRISQTATDTNMKNEFVQIVENLPELLKFICELFEVQLKDEQINLQKQIDSQLNIMKANTSVILKQNQELISKLNNPKLQIISQQINDQDDLKIEILEEMDQESIFRNLNDKLNKIHNLSRQSQFLSESIDDYNGTENSDDEELLFFQRKKTIIVDDNEQGRSIMRDSQKFKNRQSSNLQNHDEKYEKLQEQFYLLESLDNNRKEFRNKIQKLILDLSKQLYRNIDINFENSKLYNNFKRLTEIFERKDKGQQLVLNENKNLEIEQLYLDVYQDYKKSIQELPVKVYMKLENQNKLNQLNFVFLSNLEEILKSIKNHIDPDFLNQLFDEQNLYQPLRSFALEISERLIPDFLNVLEEQGQFEQQIVTFLFNQKQKKEQNGANFVENTQFWFLDFQQQTRKKFQDITQVQNTQYKNFITHQIKVYSKILSSNIQFLQNDTITAQQIASKTSQFVYYLLNQQIEISNFNLNKASVMENEKDSTGNELLYYFLHQIFQFENKLSSIQQIDNCSEKRLSLYLNEIENVLNRYDDLKSCSSNFKISELANLKYKYISLFRVISVQLLQNLTTNQLKIIYQERPGNLLRLIYKVQALIKEHDFGQNEFYLKVKMLQIVNQFSKDVVQLIFQPEFEAQLSLNFSIQIHKSIISAVQNLLFTIYVEYATIQYEYKTIVPQVSSEQQNKDQKFFIKELDENYQTLKNILNKFETIDDLQLEERGQIQIYQENLVKIISIFKVDLQNTKLNTIDSVKLSLILSPLTQIYVYYDQQTFKTKQILSHNTFEQIEKFLSEISLFSFSFKKNEQTVENNIILKSKKTQICDAFCQYYETSINQLTSGDLKDTISKRFDEITNIKDLYMKVLEFERQVVASTKEELQHGNLLAQIICLSELLIKLQNKHLTYSIQILLQSKYNTMIQNIDLKFSEQQQNKDQNLRLSESQIKITTQNSRKSQIKIISALMLYENFKTFKKAFEIGLIKSQSNATKKKYIDLINETIEALVPNQQLDDQKSYEGSFFDLAIELLEDQQQKCIQSGNFESLMQTIEQQKLIYWRQNEFKEQQEYCCYFRLMIEDYLPKNIRQEGRYFVIRCPQDYRDSQVKQDISILLEQEVSLDFVQALHLRPLTTLVREKYDIQNNTTGLSDTLEFKNGNYDQKFKRFYEQNFKNQFYCEFVQSNDYENPYSEEVCILIYETIKPFPTITMIQPASYIFEKRIPAVEMKLKEVNKNVLEIQDVIRQKHNLFEDECRKMSQQQKEKFVMESLIQKYLIGNQANELQDEIQKYFLISNKDKFCELQSKQLQITIGKLFLAFERLLIQLKDLLHVFNLFKNYKLQAAAQSKLKDLNSFLIESKMVFNFTNEDS